MRVKPVLLSFMLCRDLMLDKSMGEVTLLLGPTHEVFGAAYPLATELSLYFTWRQLDGEYRLACQLLDPEGEVVWSHAEARSLTSNDRLLVHRVILHPLRLVVPSPGLYDFVLTANEEEIFRTLLNAVWRD
jgi:hypothetical protein